MKQPTEEMAIKNMARKNARLKKPLMVAKLAIDSCLDDLQRR